MPEFKFDWRKVSFTTCLVFAALALNIIVSCKLYFVAPLGEAGSWAAAVFAPPLPVFALKIFMFAGLGLRAALMVCGFSAFSALVLFTLFAFGKRYGAMAGSMAALFTAANPYFGYYAVKSSSNLYAALFLALFWHYNSSEHKTLKPSFLAGLFGGLALLSRLDCAFVLALLVLFALVSNLRLERVKAAAVSLSLACLIAAPYLVYQKKQYHNFFYSQELSLRRWANIDNDGYKPSPGMEQEPLSLGGFVRRNGAAGFARASFKGLGAAFGATLPRVFYYKFLIVLLFLGVYFAFSLNVYNLLFFFAASLIPLLPLAAIAQIPATGGIEPRYYLVTLWALCAFAGLGLQELLVWGAKELLELKKPAEKR